MTRSIDDLAADVREQLDAICADSLECPLSQLLGDREYHETQAVSALFLSLCDALYELIARAKQAEKERDEALHAARLRHPATAGVIHDYQQQLRDRAIAAESRCATLELSAKTNAELADKWQAECQRLGEREDELTARCATLEAVVRQVDYFGKALLAREYEVGSPTIRTLVEDARAALEESNNS